MNLSDLPELREYRNAVAEGHGGGTGAALRAANIAAKRVYDKAISGTGKPRSQLSDRAIREAVASTVARVRRGMVTITGRGRQAVTEAAAGPAKKGGKRKAREARIREAVQQAIRREIAEAAGRPPASAAAPSVPLTEMSHEDLAAAITEASLRHPPRGRTVRRAAAVSALVPAAGEARARRAGHARPSGRRRRPGPAAGAARG